MVQRRLRRRTGIGASGGVGRLEHRRILRANEEGGKLPVRAGIAVLEADVVARDSVGPVSKVSGTDPIVAVVDVAVIVGRCFVSDVLEGSQEVGRNGANVRKQFAAFCTEDFVRGSENEKKKKKKKKKKKT